MGNLVLTQKVNPLIKKLYRSMIGSFLYLSASSPDIMFSVCMCAHFRANPKELHEKAVKIILRYLRTTLVLVCGIPKVHISSCLVILIWTLPGVKLVERAQ